jgi:hypothetical protein
MSNPNYIDRGGEYTFPPPCLAEGVQFYGFFVDADLNALQKMCDTYLNNPLGGKKRYVPAGPFIVMVFCSIEKFVSLTPPYSNRGWFDEQEMAVWIPLIDEIEKRMFWFFPYMWVNNPYAMAMGREIYGFPKELATFTIPPTADTADKFTMDTMVFPTYSPDTKVSTVRLIEITRSADGQKGYSPGAVWNDLESIGRDIVHILDDGLSLLGNAKMILDTLDDLIHWRMPMVFLKEFRSAATTTVAAYQSIVEAIPICTKLHSGGLLPYVYDVNITVCDSHPLRTDFGLPPTGLIRSTLGFWINFDFELPLGTETVIE